MSTEGRTGTTLPGPRRCPWCGHRCHGETCRYCGDLPRLEAKMTGDRPARFRATCPNPKCGELAKPGRKRCALCRTELYPSDAFLASLVADARLRP